MNHRTAVIYARYSSDKQREASIDDQLRVCRDFCASEGIEVVGQYTDYAMSGKTDHRPEFRRMIANAPESDYVVVYMFDRFSRDRYDSATYKRMLRECGVRVLSASERIDDSPEGGLQEGMLELLSEYYVRDLARKIRRGMEGNALKAMNNGYKVFGYSTDPDTRRFVVDEREAAIVREMFSRRLDGESVNSIAEDMADRGVRTAGGRPVDYNWAWRVLHNRAYTGLYSWGGIEVEGGMPRIVEDHVFELAQRVSPRRTFRQPGWEPYALSGKLYCGICGMRMHGYAGRGRNGRRYRYYGCKEEGGCGRRGVRCDLVEDSIADTVLKVTADERRMRAVARRIVEAGRGCDPDAAEIEACEAEMAALEREQHNLTKAALRGFLTDEMVSRNEEIKDSLRRLQERRERLEGERFELTDDLIVEFLAHGFGKGDSDFIFGSVVNTVYLFEESALLVFNFRDEVGELAEVMVALEKAKDPNPSGFGSHLRGVPADGLPQTIVLPWGFGIIVPLVRAA